VEVRKLSLDPLGEFLARFFQMGLCKKEEKSARNFQQTNRKHKVQPRQSPTMSPKKAGIFCPFPLGSVFALIELKEGRRKSRN
jgi:hypothetical protein